MSTDSGELVKRLREPYGYSDYIDRRDVFQSLQKIKHEAADAIDALTRELAESRERVIEECARVCEGSTEILSVLAGQAQFPLNKYWEGKAAETLACADKIRALAQTGKAI